MRDGPLDMRMDPTRGQSAAEWLQTAEEADIAWVLKTYGEERFAKRICRRYQRNREQPMTPHQRTGGSRQLCRRR